MKEIIVPIDFSPESFYALDVAKEISKRYTQSEIVLLNIVEVPTRATFSATGEQSTVTMDDIYVLKMIEKARDEMTDIISDPQFNGINIRIKIKVGHNGVADEITSVPADLIIMGSKGDSGLHELLLGSTAEKVVRRASCPVMTIKTKPQDFRIQDMIFASNFKEDIPAITKLKELQSMCFAKLHLLYVDTSKNFLNREKAKERMLHFAEKNSLDNYTINVKEASSSEEGISQFASDINADVIAMATHARKGFLHVLMGSLTESMVNHSKTTMFTFHMKEEETHA
ncbi:MAG TPA: universal stress protein [Cytophagales bacterium]|nr:universal stress protein [Cytophagales bacterium]